MPVRPSLYRPLGTRGHLLLFNVLVVTVTLMVSCVAIIGFKHAGNIQAEAQAQTLQDMNGGLALARDTANVATAAVQLSQVVGALEYQSESDKLRQTRQAFQHSLQLIAAAPLASQAPQQVAHIRQQSVELEKSVSHLLNNGHQRHIERNIMLSKLYQTQSILDHLNDVLQRQPTPQPDHALRDELARLITIAIHTPSPLAAIEQWDSVMTHWPQSAASPLLQDLMLQFQQQQQTLLPLARTLEQRDLAIAYYTYHIKAVVAILNNDITDYVQQVKQQTTQRNVATHDEINTIILFISAFALLALLITGYAGIYIYRNLGVNLTAIASAMTRLAQGQRDISVPALHRRDELGDLARAFNVFARNIASLEQTSKLLREKSNQLESTFQAMRDGFALFDSDGRLIVWNTQYPLLLGIDSRRLHRGLHYQQLLAALAIRPIENMDTQEIKLADGRTIELRFSPLPQRGMVNTVLERTERKALEEALVHSQKMKAVGQLTGGLAHDFNNLLAVIIGSLELTCGNVDDDVQATRINRALKAAERAAQLTQRLLAFSRKQSLNPRAIAIATLVDNLQELMQHSLLPGQHLVTEMQHPGWLAWIDSGQLENALLNLVVNARDALEGQPGEIRLRVYNQRRSQQDGEKRDYVVLDVIDHGCGMSAEVRAQVFEPFFTTKSHGNGSGLGLSMVYGFVNQSGGLIELETAPGQGTLVRLLLPRAPAQMTTEPTPVAAVASAVTEQLVLVLDDDDAVRQTLCEHLHQLGYLTLECADGESALSLLRQSEDITILISDLMLGDGLNGAETLRQALVIRPDLATLLVSGQDLRQVQGTLPPGERLAKPYSQRQLSEALLRALRRTKAQ